MTPQKVKITVEISWDSLTISKHERLLSAARASISTNHMRDLSCARSASRDWSGYSHTRPMGCLPEFPLAKARI